MKTKPIVLAIAAAALLAACGQGDDAAQAPADAPAAASSPGGQAILARQDKLEQMGDALRTMSEELKKPTPDVMLIQTNAQIIAGNGPDLPNWFPAGSGPEAGVETEARPDIWTKPDLFKTRAAAFATQAAAFHATAMAGDVEALRGGIRQLGGSCGGCHDDFRDEK